MAYKSVVVVDRIFAVRWDEPTRDDVDDLVSKLRELRATRSDHDIVFIGILPQKMGVPSDTTRAAFGAYIKEMNELCTSMHMVLLGSGLRFVAIRSMVAGMLLFGGTRRMHVDSTIEDALRKAKVPESQVMAAAKKIGNSLVEGLPAA